MTPSPRSRAFAVALDRQGFKERCKVCGAPEDIPMLGAVLVDWEELGQCDACGLILDQHGRPIDDGKSPLNVVRLCYERAPQDC